MMTTTDMAIQTVQRVISELRPSVLDDLGILAAIEWQSKEFENRNEVCGPCAGGDHKNCELIECDCK